MTIWPHLLLLSIIGLWLLLRICIFFGDRLDSVSLPPDIYPFTAWLLRLLLIIIAAGVAFLAIPGAIFAIGMGDAFGGTHSSGAYFIFGSIGIYALAALVMNFPFFPTGKLF